jgi:hypothetical protein
MKTFLSCLFLLSVVCSVSFAEMRIWEDKNGNRYEAEFVHEMFGKMTLRCKDGTEVRIPVEDFSEHDQKYLRVKVPPQVTIDFSKTDWIKPKPPEMWPTEDVQTMVKGTVTVHKESKRIFTSHLNAELFMIAEEVDGDNFILLSKTDSSFLLGDHNDDTHVFSSEPNYTRRYDEMGPSGWRGEVYAGYLVVVSDMDGNTLVTKTDIPGHWIDTPEVIKNLRELAVRGAASVRSRHFDKTGKKSQLTRPQSRPFSDTSH